MVVYLDESGALNRKPKERFFVIASLSTYNKETRKSLKNLGKSLHKKHCIPKNLDEIHASQLAFPAKQNILSRLNSRSNFHLDYIVADKKHIHKNLFDRKDLSYNYLMSHLTKKLIRGVDTDIQFILDEHTIKAGSLNSLEDYLNIEAKTKWGYRHNISVELIDSKDCKGVQLVDVVANSVFAKYNYNANHLYTLSDVNFRHRVRFPYQKFGN